MRFLHRKWRRHLCTFLVYFLDVPAWGRHASGASRSQPKQSQSWRSTDAMSWHIPQTTLQQTNALSTYVLVYGLPLHCALFFKITLFCWAACNSVCFSSVSNYNILDFVFCCYCFVMFAEYSALVPVHSFAVDAPLLAWRHLNVWDDDVRRLHRQRSSLVARIIIKTKDIAIARTLTQQHLVISNCAKKTF